ncbi:MAG TPA: Rieske 2Fe-2S domain-containing protein [Polyangiaceae bacterium]|jgi:Rieske Fe-S protein
MSASDPIPKRTFLKVGLLVNGVVGALLAVPVVRYLLSPATDRPSGADAWVSLGALDQFPIGETRLASFRNPVEDAFDGKTADIACWVRRVDADRFQVFAINCAHLGCPVRWFPQSNLFLCPCHGGAYYADGGRASGPPERGLFEYPYKLKRQELLIQPRELPTPGLVSSVEGKRHLPCV